MGRSAAAARAAAAASDGSDEETERKEGSEATAANLLQANASDASADAARAPPPAPAAPAAPAAPLASKGSDDQDEDEDDAPSAGGRETRGQMVQRHKRVSFWGKWMGKDFLLGPRPRPPHGSFLTSLPTTTKKKQELKAQKEASKRLGKKKKDEAAAAEAALAARHEAELKSLEEEEKSGSGSGNATAVAADSLSRFKLDDKGDSDGKRELPNLRKGSKAARKRAERLAADAERERQRDEERAAVAGTGAGSREAKELKAKVLRPLGLEVFDVPADGHCLYAALSHQLAQAKELREKAEREAGGGNGDGDDSKGTSTGSSSSSSSDFSVKSLRALAARHIREHAEAFEPFIDDDELPEGEEGGGRGAEGGGRGGAEGGGRGAEVPSRVERYCRRLEGTAAWGGQPELQALASALPATIRVLSAEMGPVVVEGGGGGGAKGPVRERFLLLFSRFSFSFFFRFPVAELAFSKPSSLSL